MSDPKWPAYPIGDHQSIFALGVISTNYASLESILDFIFATAAGIGTDFAQMIRGKVGAGACVQLTDQCLPPIDMVGPPTRAVAEIRHFLSAFQISTENRNLLMHSALVPQGDYTEAILYKTSKQGRTHSTVQPLKILRRVADEIRIYVDYGRALGNAINARLDSGAPVLPFPWPDRPPLPHRLEYTSDPRPLTPIHRGD